MSVRGTLGGVFASVAVLVIGWQIGTAALDHPAATTSTSGGASSGGALKDGAYTGASEQTRYGDIQVAITVSGGKITEVTTPTLQADDGRSERINSEAVPLLKQEVLQAQSAEVSMISGATFTSEGYLTSLQSALDQAS
jgi:uncharacterized protein with FMN-binding domain